MVPLFPPFRIHSPIGTSSHPPHSRTNRTMEIDKKWKIPLRKREREKRRGCLLFFLLGGGQIETEQLDFLSVHESRKCRFHRLQLYKGSRQAAKRKRKGSRRRRIWVKKKWKRLNWLRKTAPHPPPRPPRPPSEPKSFYCYCYSLFLFSLFFYGHMQEASTYRSTY